MTTAYPKRPPFFSMRFISTVCRSCAAQDISGDGVAMLVTVANVEDSKRYTGAVTFWNDQLLPILGLRSWSALERVRNRCVEAGWLHYEPGGKGRPGRYWVTIPARLEVLGQEPLGVNPGDICISENDDHSLRETRGNREGKDLSPGCTSEIGGVTEGQPRDNQGATREHSNPSPDPTPTPLPKRDAAAPTIDPDEQDITKPTKPAPDVPRGSQNDTADRSMVCPIGGLGTWIRWRVSDQARTNENRQTIVMLIDRYGLREVQQVCEALVMRGDADRPARPPGSKCWPDEILPAILASRSQASGSTIGANPPSPTPLPQIVTQAHALLASHGAAACRTALGWADHVAPSDQAMRAALERLPVATELVLALSAQPALAT